MMNPMRLRCPLIHRGPSIPWSWMVMRSVTSAVVDGSQQCASQPARRRNRRSCDPANVDTVNTLLHYLNDHHSPLLHRHCCYDSSRRQGLLLMDSSSRWFTTATTTNGTHQQPLREDDETTEPAFQSNSDVDDDNVTRDQNNNNADDDTIEIHVTLPNDEDGGITIPGAVKGGRKLAIVYTCAICNTRSTKQFTERAYQHGVVIVRCPGCHNQHLIADHLNYFQEEGGTGFDLDTIVKQHGQSVKRITDGNITQLSLEDLVGKDKMQELMESVDTTKVPPPPKSKP